MDSKANLKVGDTVYVLGCEGEIWDLVDSNPALVKVLMKMGPCEGDVFPVVLKQVDRY